MSSINISIARVGKLRAQVETIPVNPAVAGVEYRTQIAYYEAMGYIKVASKGGIWTGVNDHSVVTISSDCKIR